MAVYIQPFSVQDIQSGPPLIQNISIPIVYGCSFVNSTPYWFTVRDKSGYVVAFLAPGTQGNASFTYPIDDNLILQLFEALPTNTDISTSNYFTIRFNTDTMDDYMLDIGGGSGSITPVIINSALPAGTNHIGSVGVDGEVEVKNDSGNPLTVEGDEIYVNGSHTPPTNALPTIAYLAAMNSGNNVDVVRVLQNTVDHGYQDGSLATVGFMYAWDANDSIWKKFQISNGGINVNVIGSNPLVNYMYAYDPSDSTWKQVEITGGSINVNANLNNVGIKPPVQITDNLTLVNSVSNVSLNYGFDGTNWQRIRLNAQKQQIVAVENEPIVHPVPSADTIYTYKKTIGTSPVSADIGFPPDKVVIIQADSANTGSLYIGDSSQQEFEITKGNLFSFTVYNTATIYLRASASGQIARFLMGV